MYGVYLSTGQKRLISQITSQHLKNCDIYLAHKGIYADIGLIDGQTGRQAQIDFDNKSVSIGIIKKGGSILNFRGCRMHPHTLSIA